MRRLVPLVVAAGLAACSGPVPGGVPTVRFGQDSCARCGMLVSEPRFAAGLVDGEGSTMAFDDAGEYLAEAAARPDLAASGWVNDMEGGGWLRASEAFYLVVPGMATPMGTGLAAFRDRGRAEVFAQARGVRVLSWSEALEAFRAPSPT